MTDGQSYDTARPYPLRDDATVADIERHAWPDLDLFDYAEAAGKAREWGRDWAEVVEVIRALGEGGGFICGPDHHIKPDVPPENTVALFDAATSVRAAGITRR
jgi:hypothetical protein